MSGGSPVHCMTSVKSSVKWNKKYLHIIQIDLQDVFIKGQNTQQSGLCENISVGMPVFSKRNEVAKKFNFKLITFRRSQRGRREEPG